MRISKIVILTLCYSLFASGTVFALFDEGSERTVDYAKYGKTSGAGTFDYKYEITDREGLAKASGEGIDPSISVTRDPLYAELKKAGKLKGRCWDHIGTGDPDADFFVWATSYNESPGVRLFFTGKALEAGGHYLHAIKAYYAAMVLYPTAYAWNRDRSWTWLVGPAAWNTIINLTRMHPELELKLTGAYVLGQGGIGGDPKRNKVSVYPGKFMRFTKEDRKKYALDASKLTVVKRTGGKKVFCVKYSNGQWVLFADGKPYFIRGLSYNPTKVGTDYNWGWMEADENNNGINDTAYEAGDFKLMKEMGCNTIRLYDTGRYDLGILRDLYKTYGIRVLICDPFGAYTVHSGATWEDGTDYTSKTQREKMKEYVRKMVLDYKDEEWVLGYILGNENNMPGEYMGVNASRTRALSQPKEYAEFLNEVAKMVHELDPDHIIGVGNMGLGLVDYYAKYAPNLDFIGINDYPGSDGFGSLWIQARANIDRPILITEFGCDAFATGKGEDQDAQANYLVNAWKDIVYNSAGHVGEGNSIGGIVFEWLDEWWKDTRGDALGHHSEEPTFEMSFPDGYSQEEWLGIVSQGDGTKSPFFREPRKAYYELKKLWTR